MRYVYGTAKGPASGVLWRPCVTCGQISCNCKKVNPKLYSCPVCAHIACICNQAVPIVCSQCRCLPCICTVVIPRNEDWDLGEDETMSTLTDDFPHQCPNCGGPAYIGLMKIDCLINCKESDKE